jgi:mitochondrial fission protein ELM1
MAQPAIVIWALTDGLAGHENQTRGLLQALAARTALAVHWLRAPKAARTLVDLALGRFPSGRGLPDPDLAVGAGHGTHLALLAARRARGGRALVLMKPSLPLACFDLCLIPRHDGVQAPNVLATRGALNALQPAAARAPDRGLILLGGPSRHYRWAEDEIARQVEAVVARRPDMNWTLAGSRRTPPSTLGRLRALLAAGVRIVPIEETAPGWLAGELSRAACAWVSEDSVSMIYEALTAGAATGVLAAPRRGASRVTRGVDELIAEGLVTPFGRWREGRALAPPPVPFDEAGRAADWILRWLAA